MKISFTKQATKDLLKMDKAMAKRFRDAFDMIANGEGSDLDIKKLKKREGYRLRIGKYRAIYNEDGQILLIRKIGSRGDVYK